MLKQLISLATSSMTLTTMWLLGKKDHRGWIVGLCSQAVWLLFIFMFAAWGLLPLSVCLTFMYIYNLRKWRRDSLIKFEGS
jgi:hydrogenase-4 membrane subunit HyfE